MAAVVTDHEGQVLVVKRRNNDDWEIPGGVLELGESMHAGLRREIEEETGLVVEHEWLTGVYKNLRLDVVALVFRARAVAGQVRSTAESAVDWWTADRVAAEMSETFAVRVLDVLAPGESTFRLHEGVRVIDEDALR